jgi:hypothetical protein
MKKITNTEEANHYYSKVNELVDKYIQEWKVKPTEVKNYFRKNMKSFLERNGLSDVEGIERVVNDVVTHRVHMELDKVMKFENFRIDENVLALGHATIQHEKILSDYYSTSMGHIEVVDEGMHVYRIEEFGKKVVAIIFSEEELDKVYKNIEDAVLEDNKHKVLSIGDVEGVKIDNIKIWLSEIINEDAFRAQFKARVDKDALVVIIKQIVQKSQSIPVNFSNDRLQYKGENKGYHIWEIR